MIPAKPNSRFPPNAVERTSVQAIRGAGNGALVKAASDKGRADRNENRKPPEEVEHRDQSWFLIFVSHKRAFSVRGISF